MRVTFANVPKIALALVAALIVTAFGSCNRNNAGTASATAAKAAGPVIDLERTPCYGTCPIYRATISQNGHITFTGKKFIDLIGTFEADIPEAQVTQLLKEIDQANFFARDSVYVTGATDFPSIILRVRHNGRYHTVRTEGEGPKELEQLMQRIDQTILQAVRQGKRTPDGKQIIAPERRKAD